MKSNSFKENIQPTLVLTLICLVMTFLLAYVNGVTAPIIEENSIKTANENRAILLPSATDFEAVAEEDLLVYTEGQVWVTECYKATNGTGMVVTVKSKSFGGILTEMIGIDENGAITGVKITAHSDTKGLGTKAHDAANARYTGITELDDASNVKSDSRSADLVTTGASISSNGVYQGVCCALEQFKKLGGAN